MTTSLDQQPAPGGSAPGAEPDVPPRRRWRRLRRVLVILALLLMLPGISFVRAMTYPGSAPASVRAVEWVRDHGGGGLVDLIENWRYSHDAPPARGAPADQTPAGLAPSGPGQTGRQPSARPGSGQPQGGPVLPRIGLLTGVSALPGEGAWRVARVSATHRPVLYTTWFRPDPAHQPVVAGVALIPRAGTALHLEGGTREPVPGLSWPDGSRVPPSQLGNLVAAFNAGFKTRDARGGWFGAGRTAVPLVSGAASLVIYQDGHAEVGAWGQGLSMTHDVTAVRQNLALVVRNGQPVPGLTSNANGRWGTAHIQFQYTYRSGIGTDADGNLIYVAGQRLTLATLAQAMQRAGIRTGMELDMHPAMVTFNIFGAARAGHVPAGHKLLSSMTRPASRYLVADQRDFFYVTAP